MNMSKYIERRTVSLPHMGAVAFNWLVIGGCVAASEYFRNPAMTLAALIIIGARQHAMVVLMHDAAHIHFARNKTLNDWLSNLLCAFPLTLETAVYRKVHLAHHSHLNSRQDPDLLRKEKQSGWNLPAPAWKVALFIPAFIFVIGPKEMIALLWGFSGFGTPKRWLVEPRFMAIKMSYYAAIAAFCVFFGIAQAVLFYWFIPVLFVLPFVARVRNLSEHAALSLEDENNSTREVTPGRIESFLLAPHNVHLHLTHHHYPHVPFYHLPKVHAELKAAGKYDGAHINSSYFLPYENSVLSDVINGPSPKKTRDAEMKTAA